MSELFLLVANTFDEPSQKSDIVLIGSYKTLDEAYRNAESFASVLFKPDMKSFSVHRLSDESLVNVISRSNLSTVIMEMLGWDGGPPE